MPNDQPKTKQAASAGKLIWLWLTVLVLVADQITKTIADEYLSYNIPVQLLPILNLTLHYNEGAAFSFLADAGGWQRWFFTVLTSIVSLVLLVWLKRLRPQETLLAIALALILGGALGNLYDRVSLGYVIDFISVHYEHRYFPTFNVADSAISIGAVLLLWDALVQSRRGEGDGAAENKSEGAKGLKDGLE